MSEPAFAVYNSLKNKKKRKRSKKKSGFDANTAPDDNEYTEDCEIEEILDSRPSTSGTNTSKKNKMKRKASDDILIEEKDSGLEIIDIDENSDDIITIEDVRKEQRRAKKRPISVVEVDDETICEGRINGTIKGKKSSKNGKKINRKSSREKSAASEVTTREEDSEEDDDTYSGNSLFEGQKLFTWLINPVNTGDFFKNTWEKRPLHIRRGAHEYYKPLISTPIIDRMLRTSNIEFTKNLDITSYTNGKRETHNPDGRALPSVVWDYYKNGCSVRLLNPQTFIPKLALLNSTLQDYFGTFVGANSYLTPPNSQGFAPHYDDIEAFILQVEGKKHWRLYAPRGESEYLPRFSSGNFEQTEIGKPILEVTLEAGDLLYFPRGTIHQGNTVPGSHSLHVTLSCYQRNTWGDLMQKAVTAALQVALEEDVEFRRGLPTDYLSYMGIVHSDEKSPQRTAFIERVKELIGKLATHAPIDSAVDQMGKQFMHDALPPVLNPEEKECSAFSDGLRMEENGNVTNAVEFKSETKVKLLRAHVLRLVTEEDTVRLYHCVNNSLEYHGNEPQFLEIPAELAPAVEYLIRSYPKFVEVSEIPLESYEQKVTIVGDLWDRGLLLTEKPLKKV